MTKKIRKIVLDINKEDIINDLKRYKEKTIELGATKVRIIKTNEILIDERVILKCQVPRCFGFGVSAHCPPNTLKPAELRTYLEKYGWAVFFIKEIPSEVIVRDKATIKERVAEYQQVFKIVGDIESMAFYDGYYFAFGFAAGSCRHTFCGLENNCIALEGKRCRFSLRARPSMEAVGIDVYKMITQSGWDVYPIGSNAEAKNIPKGTLAGLVVIC